MDKIETTSNVTHWLIERIDQWPDDEGMRLGKTACGRTLRGIIGQCIPTIISCGNCKRAMRKAGWQV